MRRNITYIIERDHDGNYTAEVPELPGCHTQAKSLDQLEERIKEAILLYLEINEDKIDTSKFVGIQQPEVIIE